MRRTVLKLAVALVLLGSASIAKAAGQIGVIEMGDNFRSPPLVIRARLWPLGKKGVPVQIRTMHGLLNVVPVTTRGYVVISAEKYFGFFDSTATRQTAEGARVYPTGVWGSARVLGVEDAEIFVHFIAFSGRGTPRDSAELVALWNRHEEKRK